MRYDDYDKLEDLPSLKPKWVRVVHRLIAQDGKNVQSIKSNGLIFNRMAAKCNAHQKGGSYDHVTSMVSVYDEDTFWQSMQQDDFACFNDEKYADTKLVFDMPMDEFCFLQAYGRIIKGKIDSKYLVGCVKNVNGKNLQLKTPVAEILKAEKISKNNPPSDVVPNNLTTLINHLIMKFPKEKREEAGLKICEKMSKWREEITDFWTDEKKRFKSKFLIRKTNDGR